MPKLCMKVQCWDFYTTKIVLAGILSVLCSTLSVVLPAIWFLELDRLDNYKEALRGNSTLKDDAESLSSISGVK